MTAEKTDLTYPVIPADRGDDLHNLEFADSADLVLFVAGNQFMVMEELLEAFQSQYPGINRIFYETLPPGLELKQILAGGALFTDKLIDVWPDVYASVSEAAMKQLIEKDLIFAEDYFLYLHNRIVLMVPEGNPAKINSVQDLARSEVRISQPNPEYEDIAFHILDMYRDAGGEILLRRIMEEKRAEGTTILTTVHHRETPLRIEKDLISAEDYFLYLHNRIVLMVPEGNPARINSVQDLGRSEVRISQPNPEYEDIAFHIMDMYRDAGGETLVHRIMEEKRAEGTTILTTVHHRETPLRVEKGEVDVGPVWATEIRHAQQNKLPVDVVEPGEGLDQREKINYYICPLKGSANPENGEKFLNFIQSSKAQGIYEKYGFVPHFST